jgi:DNA modification methylase
MGKKWDYQIPSVDVWREALRVLKPGGHALIACGTRTQHRMVVNIEDAGFEIRDVVSYLHSQEDSFQYLWDSFSDEQKKLYGAIHQDNTVLWGYGSGFPKSHNVSKAIDKAAGAEREDIGKRFNAAGIGESNGGSKFRSDHSDYVKPTGATPEAQQWDGWGTALKPAVEFFTLCRKPLSEKTIAANVLEWGTGGINIDGCRVEAGEDLERVSGGSDNAIGKWGLKSRHTTPQSPHGRFPANLILDGSEEVTALFPVTGKSRATQRNNKASDNNSMAGANLGHVSFGHDDNGGSAARFFYCPKASKRDRDEGLDGFEERRKVFNGQSTKQSGDMKGVERKFTTQPKANFHPTVKPTALMRYLCRLITPPNGTVLDCYMGSGSTGKAAILEGFHFVGIEREPEFLEIASARIKHAAEEMATTEHQPRLKL